MQKLQALGIKNLVYDPYLVRGFDYYTGMVFEMYDVNPKNPRALFGGGRYDDLVEIFGVEKVPGVGFGWGDVTTKDFLETYNLLPEYQPPVQLYIAHLDGYLEAANKLASDLRKQSLNVAVDLTDRKVSAQIKTADKEQIPFIVVVGEEEVKTGNYKVKSLKESKETKVEAVEIANLITVRAYLNTVKYLSTGEIMELAGWRENFCSKNSEGKYLFVRRNPKVYPEVGAKWDIVGGRIEAGTPLIENLKREIKEEVGLDYVGEPKLVAAQDILIDHKYTNGTNNTNQSKHVVRLTYIGFLEGHLKVNDDHTEAAWFTVEEIKS